MDMWWAIPPRSAETYKAAIAKINDSFPKLL